MGKIKFKFKFSNKAWAVKKRIENLPELFERSMRTVYKKDADALVREFEEGIKSDTLGLKRLTKETIEQKKRKGQAKPHTPLYGEGDYAGMKRVTRQGKKWVVKESRGKHHSGLSYRDIHDIHEKGKSIKKRGGGVFQIPARPATNKAFISYLKKRKKIDSNTQIIRAVNQLIRKNKIDK